MIRELKQTDAATINRQVSIQIQSDGRICRMAAAAAREEIVGDYSVPEIITQYKGLLLYLGTTDYCKQIVERVGC